MPYITKEQVSEKRKALKAALPDYKLSVVRKDLMAISVSIVKGPHAFELDERGYKQVNHFSIDRVYENDPEALRVLSTIRDIASADQTELVYDGDYGSVPTFYVNMSIGKWDRPYECTSKQVAEIAA